MCIHWIITSWWWRTCMTSDWKENRMKVITIDCKESAMQWSWTTVFVGRESLSLFVWMRELKVTAGESIEFLHHNNSLYVHCVVKKEEYNRRTDWNSLDSKVYNSFQVNNTFQKSFDIISCSSVFRQWIQRLLFERSEVGASDGDDDQEREGIMIQSREKRTSLFLIEFMRVKSTSKSRRCSEVCLISLFSKTDVIDCDRVVW